MNKLSRGWHGPAKVIGQVSTCVFLSHGGRVIRAHPAHIKRVADSVSSLGKAEVNKTNQPITVIVKEEESCSDEPERLEGESNIQQHGSLDPLNETTSQVDDAGINQNLRVSSRIRSPPDFFGVPIRSDEISDINISENEHAFIPAKQRELDSWLSNGVYEVVSRDLLKHRAISVRWVLTWKQLDNGQKQAKARLVVKGFLDKAKDDVASFSPTVSKDTLRLVLSLFPTLGFVPHTADVKTAFLQGRELSREVYVIPPPEADMPEDVVWKLRKGV